VWDAFAPPSHNMALPLFSAITGGEGAELDATTKAPLDYAHARI
jgi:hypothetical protein